MRFITLATPLILTNTYSSVNLWLYNLSYNTIVASINTFYGLLLGLLYVRVGGHWAEKQ